jgi:serine/threonine-protein kinase
MTAAGPSNAQLPRPGDMIAGKYVLDRLLGQGGMGAVFAAKHVKLSKAVAIKIMLADASNPEAAQRFINEGRAAANIQNEHVVRVDDVDEEMGYAYMVLELLDGEDLAQILDREPTHRLPAHVVVDYVLQALKGVTQAHAIGIVHRDLKPSNLFLARRKDGSSVVKVLDFGISKAQGSSALAASPSALTSTKAMLGSPLYMSPEQLRSSKSVDQRADIWAMGVILYELITGTLPFMGENLGELFAAILETDPAPLRTRAENVPPGLDDIVLRCLQRRPEHRFQSAAELANALAPFAVARPGGVPITPNPALGGTAMMPPGMVSAAMTPRGGAITPGPGAPPIPQLSGSNPGMDARPFAGTGSGVAGGWQSTGGGGGVPGLSKAKTSLLVLAVGAFMVTAIAVVAFVLVPRKTKVTSETPPPVAASVVAPVASTSAPVVASTPVVAPTPTEVASAAPPTTATSGGSHVAPSTTKTSKPIAKTDPPKPAEPTPTPRPTTPKPSGGALQEAR